MIVTADKFLEQVRQVYKAQTCDILGSPLFYMEQFVSQNIEKIKTDNLWIGVVMSLQTGLVGAAIIPIGLARNDSSSIFTSPEALRRLLLH